MYSGNRRFFRSEGSPSIDVLYSVGGDIAATFGWSPQVIFDLDLDELSRWRKEAEARQFKG